jgi:pyruvate,water dikinase
MNRLRDFELPVHSRVKTMIRMFSEISIEDIPIVGGKNASLGEMYRELTPRGVRLANGFAVTAEGYWRFLKESGLDRRIRQILD